MQNDLIPDYMKPLVSLQLLNIPNVMEEMQRERHQHEIFMRQMQMQHEMTMRMLGCMNNNINSW